MDNIAAFDVGTTAVKGVLVSAEGQVVLEKSIMLETIFFGNKKEQRPQDWYTAFCEISNYFFQEGMLQDKVLGIVMSGQMQDLIPVSKDCKPVCNAILYSDGRAEVQAQKMMDCIGINIIEQSTGNHFDGSMPFAKLLWLKEEEPSLYEAVEKILISSKDYVVAMLTGEFITDVTSASTAGLMDIHRKSWNTDWMEKIGLDSRKLPSIRYADELVGSVGKQASVESGFAVGTPVYAGTGDAGATTLASGIAQDDEFNINLGTSGWIACVSNEIMNKAEVFNLAAMQRDSYINVVPFLNAGNVHKWISGILAPTSDSPEKYEYLDGLLNQSDAGSNGVMFLPYLVGERFPVMDTTIKGGYIGITPETAKQDLARSVLEGVAFSIRQGLDRIGRSPKKISLIGGGAKVKTWCQILADTLNQRIDVYDASEYLPAAAIAGAVLIGQGNRSDYASYINSLLDGSKRVSFVPNVGNAELYHQIYNQYLKVYPAFKSIL